MDRASLSPTLTASRLSECFASEIAVLQDEVSGQEGQKHVSLLKIMPKVFPSCGAFGDFSADKRQLQEMQCVGPFWLVAAKGRRRVLVQKHGHGQAATKNHVEIVIQFNADLNDSTNAGGSPVAAWCETTSFSKE